MLAVTAGRFLHLAVGAQQSLLACARLGPSAPEGGKEPVAPFAEVGGEEGVQPLPAEEGRWGSGMRRGSGAEGLRVWPAPGQGQARAPIRTAPDQHRGPSKHAWWVTGLKGRPGDQKEGCKQAPRPDSPWLEGFSTAPRP